jgi:hypothetical protein
MTLPKAQLDREYQKFRDAGEVGKTKVAVTYEDDSSGLIVDQVSSTIIYLGEGLFGALTSEAKWKIKKIDLSSGVRITSASTDFDQVWDNRASLIYV